MLMPRKMGQEGSVLSTAMQQKHRVIIEPLIHHQYIYLRYRGRSNLAPLRVAINSGYEGLEKLILDRNLVSVNDTDEYFGSELT
jgi:hypothetical protein